MSNKDIVKEKVLGQAKDAWNQMTRPQRDFFLDWLTEEDREWNEHAHLTLKVTDPRNGGSVQRYPVADDEQVIGEESLAWRNEGFEVEVVRYEAEE